MDKPKPAHFLNGNSDNFRYVEKTNPQSSNLQFLTYGVYELTAPVQTGWFTHATEEALLFCWKGNAELTVGDKTYALETYDVFYVPRGTPYRFSLKTCESKIIICRAPAEKVHPVFHAKWKEFSRDEK